MSMYHEGQRALQDRCGGRAVADRLEQHRLHRTFTDEDRALIETAPCRYIRRDRTTRRRNLNGKVGTTSAMCWMHKKRLMLQGAF
jgi:hypothetical protein